PVKYRIGQDLYIKYARDYLFSGKLSILKEIDCTTDLMDLRPVEERSLYEKILYYRTFIHSYYDESINNPVWGRYFKNPLISRFLIKNSTYDNKGIEAYPLLSKILAYRNEKKYRMTINGISALEYIAGIKEEAQLSRGKMVLNPIIAQQNNSLD
ncbi:MAG: asparagine synthetase B, partial [Methanosarcina sp.]